MFVIPIHFSIAAWELANATAEKMNPGGGQDYALPQELVTTASSAQMQMRLKASEWTVYAFISVASLLLVYSMALLTLMSTNQARLPNTTSFPDIDSASKAAYPRESELEERDLASTLRYTKLDIGGSRDVIKKLRAKRLHFTKAADSGNGSGGTIVVSN